MDPVSRNLQTVDALIRGEAVDVDSIIVCFARE